MFSTTADNFDFAGYLSKTQTSKHKLTTPLEHLSGTIERLFGGRKDTAPRLPWGDIDFQMRPHECTVWAGANGHGKSMVTSQVMLNLMLGDFRVGLASFEMTPEALNGRLIRQASGGLPSEDYAVRLMEWMEDRLWYAAKQGATKVEEVMGMVRYAAREKSVQHFFIDNLMFCVRGEDDLNAQKEFIQGCCTIARDEGIHVHIVHHVRKLEDDIKVPSKFDIKGSSTITDLVDNVILVIRNKKKERDLELTKTEEDRAKLRSEKPDTMLLIDKQRHGTGDRSEGRVKLWYHGDSNSYHGHQMVRRPFGFEIPESPKAAILESLPFAEDAEDEPRSISDDELFL